MMKRMMIVLVVIMLIGCNVVSADMDFLGFHKEMNIRTIEYLLDQTETKYFFFKEPVLEIKEYDSNENIIKWFKDSWGTKYQITYDDISEQELQSEVESYKSLRKTHKFIDRFKYISVNLITLVSVMFIMIAIPLILFITFNERKYI